MGLAGWEEALLIGLGIVLLLAEIFIIPGFGVAGVLGVLALGAGTFLSFLGSYPTPAEIWRVSLTLLTVLVLVATGIGVTLLFLPRTPFWSRLSLKTRLDKDESTAHSSSQETPVAPLLGAEGKTVTPLLPSGTGLFQGKRLDIISEGEHIPGDTPVQIIQVEGNRLVVRPIESQAV